MEAYHGTSAGLFETFSLEHTLEGSGKAKFGFGVYFTEKYGMAAHYAYNRKRPKNDVYYVYTAVVPDRREDNCLSLLKGVQVEESIVRRTEAKLGESVPAEAKTGGIPFRKYLANRLTGNEGTVRQMTDKATPQGEAAASAFLVDIGVDLIEWPYNWNRPEAEKNWVVLDVGKIRILRAEKVALDPKGHHLVEGSRQLVKEW